MLPQEETREIPSGTFSGWLFKVKGDGARAKWLNPLGQRYFTIDFDNQVLFYSHSQSSRQVSVPMPFANILGASMSEEDLPGLVAGLIGAAPERSGNSFTLHTIERRVRLAAKDERDALYWVEQLNHAKTLGQGRGAVARQHNRCSEARSSDCAGEACDSSQAPSTRASGSSCGSAPSGRTSPSSEAGCFDSTVRLSQETVDCMDVVEELQSALESELEAKAASALAAQMQQPKRCLEAADFGLEDDGDAAPPEECDEAEDSAPPSPVPCQGDVAVDDDSDAEGDQEARQRRALDDLKLVAPARAGVGTRSGAHKEARREARKAERRSKRAEETTEGRVAAGLSGGDNEIAERIVADLHLARGSGKAGGSASAAGCPESTEAAARRAQRLAEDLCNGDADSTARVAADLLLVERLRGAGGNRR